MFGKYDSLSGNKEIKETLCIHQMLIKHLLNVSHVLGMGGESSEQDKCGLCPLSSRVQCRMQTKITRQYSLISAPRGLNTGPCGRRIWSRIFLMEKHQEKLSGGGGT